MHMSISSSNACPNQPIPRRAKSAASPRLRPVRGNLPANGLVDVGDALMMATLAPQLCFRVNNCLLGHGRSLCALACLSLGASAAARAMSGPGLLGAFPATFRKDALII